MGDRRGLSTKHSLMLIGIIAVVIVIILVAVLRGNGGSDNSLLRRVELDLDIQNVKMENDSSATIDVKRKQGAGDLIGLEFIFDDGQQTEIIQLNYFMMNIKRKHLPLF